VIRIACCDTLYFITVWQALLIWYSSICNCLTSIVWCDILYFDMPSLSLHVMTSYDWFVGTLGTSAAHRLSCRLFPVLQRAHLNIFLLRTVASIGEIVAVRVWHYNMGESPQWQVLKSEEYFMTKFCLIEVQILSCHCHDVTCDDIACVMLNVT